MTSPVYSSDIALIPRHDDDDIKQTSMTSPVYSSDIALLPRHDDDDIKQTAMTSLDRKMTTGVGRDLYANGNRELSELTRHVDALSFLFLHQC